MGQIYFGEDPQLKRQVAVKVSSLARGSEDPRFSKEAEVLAQLAHPNVVPIHAIGVDGQGRPYYSMKLVKGRTLQAVLEDIAKGEPVAVREYPRAALLTIFRKVCDAMMFAHSKRILHRDLKPENIMVGEYGEVLVMDWGLAKVLGEREEKGGTAGGLVDSGDYGMTMEGEVMGTPQYMSPEQAQGMVAELDERSDVYALGGILYAVLTLHPPIEGRTLEEVLTKVRKGEISAMATRRGGREGAALGEPGAMVAEIPEALRAVTLKAMSTDRSKRYGSVEEFAADIDAYQHGFATSALQVSAFGQFVLLVNRNRGVSVSIATALAAIAVLTSWFVVSLKNKERAATRAAEVAEAEKNKAQQAERLAQASFSQAQIALAEASFRSGDFPAMNEALGLCPENQRDQTWRYLAAKIDSSAGELRVREFENPRLIRSVPGMAGLFAFSNAGGEIGFIEVDSGKVVRKIRTASGLRNFVFSGDGLVVAALVGAAELRLYDAQTGTQRSSVTLPETPVNLSWNGPSSESLRLDKTGALLTAIVEPKDGRAKASLLVVEVPSGKVRWRFDASAMACAEFCGDGSRVVLVAGGATRFCWVFDTATGGKLSESPLYGICEAMHPDGKRVAVGTQEGEVKIIDVMSGTVIQNAKLHSGRLMSLAWTADGHLLTMGTEGKHYDTRWIFKLWAPRTLSLRAIFSGLKPGDVVRFAYDPLSGHLVTQESPLRLWRIPAGREWVRLNHRSETGYSGAFLSDEVALARQAWGLTLYDLGKPSQVTRVKDAPSWTERYCAVNHKAGVIATSDAMGQPQIKIFSFEGTSLKELSVKPIERIIGDMSFNERGDALAVTLGSGSLAVVAVPSGESSLKVPGKFEKAIFAGPEQRLIVSQPSVVKSDKVEYQLQQLNSSNGALVKAVSVRFRIQALASSPDQRVLAVAGTDRSIYFYDPQTLEALPSFRAHDDEIGALAFHPSLPILASASSDGSVKLWNYENKKLLDFYVGLAGAPVTLAFSPNGRFLLSEAQEDTTRIYDVSHLNASTVLK
jgi:WD40 repeat protein